MIRAKGAKTFFQNTNNTQRWIFELKLSLPESFIRGLKVSEWDCGGWLYSLAGSVGQSDVDFNNNNSNNNNIDDEDNCCLSNPALDITSYTQPWNTFSPLFAGLISLSLSLSLSSVSFAVKVSRSFNLLLEAKSRQNKKSLLAGILIARLVASFYRRQCDQMWE